MRAGWAATAVMAVAAVLGFAAAPAHAHEAGTTGVEIEVGATQVEVVFDLPLEPMATVLGTPVADGTFELSLQRETIVSYVAEHLEVSSTDEVWSETFGRLTSIRSGGVRSLRLEATVVPSSETTDLTTGFTFAYDGLIAHDADQLVFVTVLDEQGQVTLAGVLDVDTPSLVVGGSLDDDTASIIGTMMREGFHHVLDGADHVLFLLMLLIPAPLVAAPRRWERAPSGWRALREVATVATAFTVGHSSTLVASALGWVTFSTRTVEVVIALSVALSAVHAIRPLIGHGEVVMAGTFGLVHGLAFASILDRLALDSAPVWSLLGFNLGIELAQLAVIGSTFPSLFLLSRRGCYTPLRITAAVLTLGASTGWVVERLGLASSPFGAIETAVVDHLGWAAAALALGAVLSARWMRAPRLMHLAGDGVAAR